MKQKFSVLHMDQKKKTNCVFNKTILSLELTLKMYRKWDVGRIWDFTK